MKKKIELLAPGGDVDSIKAAIAAGADAIYCGLNKFNARNRATNLNLDEFRGVIHLAHRNKCKVFLTLNIVIVGSEIPYLIHVLNKLANTGVDALIVQDFGVFYLLSKYFSDIELHASTQLNTHNVGQINFLSKLGVCRANLARELNIREIKNLTLAGQKKDMLTEVFVHGSYCISFSGLCYISSLHSGNSGNRGRCSQPCRDRYSTTSRGNNFPLNLKDNSAFKDLRLISNAGVAAVKIEGRIKKYEYVYTVVKAWKKQLEMFYRHNQVNHDNSDLYKVFNRDFSNSYLAGDISNKMFIDNPRDNSIQHLSDIHNYPSEEKKEAGHLNFYKRKAGFSEIIKNEIGQLSIAKIPAKIRISGKQGTCLTVEIITQEKAFVVRSKTILVKKKRQSIAKCLTYDFLLERFKVVNDTHFFIEKLELESLENDLFISFKEISSIRTKIISTLSDSKTINPLIEVPFLTKPAQLKTQVKLSVLICSKADIGLCNKTDAEIFYQLDNSFNGPPSDLVDLFNENKNLIPWFPSVLIGENFKKAVKFLLAVKPKLIVTNNIGIAYEAYKRKISWVAGPYLNITNSFSLLCLKEKFDCSGSFISNEMGKHQIKRIIPPEDFKLYYSIYHPISLLTSRQCLLHQVIGCEKQSIDDLCIQTCQKASSITDMKNRRLLIDKTKGNYHSIYNDRHFLNMDIVKDIPGMFSSFLIDLRNIKTKTVSNIGLDKYEMTGLFEDLLEGKPGLKEKLNAMINPTTKVQYEKGI